MENEKIKKEQAVLFEEKEVRRMWYKEQWNFSVVDVVRALTGSQDARNYWKVLKSRLKEEGNQSVTKCNQLKFLASDGKYYLTDAATTENILRLIQSIPSPKAEPFKLWLARVGYERIQEIEDPELAMDRMKSLYEKKGYPKDWIGKRSRGIAVRHSLTDEWRDRGIKNSLSYAILTNEIMESAFGLKVDDYKKLKGLEKENLRDHMNDMELIKNVFNEAELSENSVTEESSVTAADNKNYIVFMEEKVRTELAKYNQKIRRLTS
jgi:hypothetical protein